MIYFASVVYCSTVAGTTCDLLTCTKWPVLYFYDIKLADIRQVIVLDRAGLARRAAPAGGLQLLLFVIFLIKLTSADVE